MPAPGEMLAGEMTCAEVCVFVAQEDRETTQAFAQVLNQLIGCYRYLEKDLEDEVKKLRLFFQGFAGSQRNKVSWLC